MSSIQQRCRPRSSAAWRSRFIIAIENGTPVPFTDDPMLARAIRSADEITLDDVTLRVMRAVDLVRKTIRMASDPAARRSKRLSDLSDAQGLLEAYPDLRDRLAPEEVAVLDRLPL